jgi:hypothetical protein
MPEHNALHDQSGTTGSHRRKTSIGALSLRSMEESAYHLFVIKDRRTVVLSNYCPQGLKQLMKEVADRVGLGVKNVCLAYRSPQGGWTDLDTEHDFQLCLDQSENRRVYLKMYDMETL